jgi:hypothetical protein
MTKMSWLKVLLLEILSVPVAIALFRFIPSKRVAAVFAGIIFISIGVLVLRFAWQQDRPFLKLSLWASLIHLFATSLPLFIYRVLFFSQDFTQVSIFTVPGPIFHYYSEKVYLGLILSTLIDGILHWVKMRQLRAKTLS